MRSSLNLNEPAAESIILVQNPSGLNPPLGRMKGQPGEKEAIISTRDGASASRMRNLALVSVLVLVLAWVVSRHWPAGGFDYSGFVSSLRNADLRWLILSWLLVLVSYYGRVLRWMVMLRPISPDASRAKVFSATAIGFAAVVILGRAGEFVRPYLIARWARVSFVSQLSAWLLERIYDTLTVLAIFGYSLAAIAQTGHYSSPTLIWVFQKGGVITGVACTICLAVLAGLQRSSDRLGSRICEALGFLQQHHQEKAAKFVSAALDGLRSARSFRSIGLLFAYSALEWVLIYLCFFAAFQAFPETAALSSTSVLVYIGFVAFGSIVQIPGIGGGVQVVSILVLTELFHLGVGPATSVALATWAISLVGIVPVGLFCAFREGLSWRSLRELGKEATL